MNRSEARSVLIVSGGTGGHIFPATVFGRWLERERGLSVAYLSGSRPLEAEIYASAGVEPYRLSLEGSPLGVRSPARVLRRSAALLSAFGETSRCLKAVRPETVFLFGGYVSFAPLLLCRMRGIPVVVHEQNAVAGRVTRLASRLGAAITAGWQECSGLKGTYTTVGIPVREPRRLPRGEALRRLGLELPEGTRVTGVASGSLGSRPLMARLLEAAEALRGRGDVAFVLLGEPVPGGGENVHFVGRQWDMNPFYSLCDALVCRAGGSTLAEALRWGIPALAIPWEGAAEGHQVRNALCFAALGGGDVWRENSDTPLARALEGLLERPASPREQTDGAESLLRGEASRRLAGAAGL
ncbi:MAG: UDP-N-acetylglucosamine--N-acetylmuramyl-(pentapeptide) pyrophosphoryl-undecaprenol N-acetylglucosamine transferase [Fretibacterium sp.]|nr:UDP-N-acetylglucosamine--N-acetylmuramyl-(pentapeptide) pyrophosphoryl-undecaprenol N-acetylglucosamine transferase [Fretibacterium sp.]